MEIETAAPSADSLRSIDGLGLLAVAAVDAPATAVRDPANLLHL
jgi:hypothetical protein